MCEINDAEIRKGRINDWSKRVLERVYMVPKRSFDQINSDILYEIIFSNEYTTINSFAKFPTFFTIFTR